VNSAVRYTRVLERNLITGAVGPRVH
jgi:hypothetical protein